MAQVITLGVFDGVHRGHREILKQVVNRARALGKKSVAYTFDPHPAKILSPDSSPSMINTVAQRVDLLKAQGIDQVVVQKFTKTFASQTAEVFFEKIIRDQLKACEIFVGYDFTFGVHRSGTFEHLKAFGRKDGIVAHQITPFFWKETLVSSTQIRQLLARGNVAKANELLARPYYMEGEIVSGRGVGEKVLKTATANLESDNDLIVSTGVYVTKTHIGKNAFESVTNVGTSPTFGQNDLTVETHLLDYKKNLVGQKVRIEFLEKIREEMVFPSPATLAAQIGKDIAFARKHFSR